MRDENITKQIESYLDLNYFTNAEGEYIDNKVGAIQDIYDFVLLDHLEEKEKLEAQLREANECILLLNEKESCTVLKSRCWQLSEEYLEKYKAQ